MEELYSINAKDYVNYGDWLEIAQATGEILRRLSEVALKSPENFEKCIKFKIERSRADVFCYSLNFTEYNCILLGFDAFVKIYKIESYKNIILKYKDYIFICVNEKTKESFENHKWVMNEEKFVYRIDCDVKYSKYQDFVKAITFHSNQFDTDKRRGGFKYFDPNYTGYYLWPIDKQYQLETFHQSFGPEPIKVMVNCKYPHSDVEMLSFLIGCQIAGYPIELISPTESDLDIMRRFNGPIDKNSRKLIINKPLIARGEIYESQWPEIFGKSKTLKQIIDNPIGHPVYHEGAIEFAKSFPKLSSALLENYDVTKDHITTLIDTEDIAAAFLGKPSDGNIGEAKEQFGI